jgi:PD-(D/E)XK nuclease superfamily
VAGFEGMWRTKLPSEWPSCPSEMSYSALREIETCPRKWALSRASYPDIWRRTGYPSKMSRAQLFGIVVHKAVETVLDTSSEIPYGDDESAGRVATLRKLGGFSTVVAEAVGDALESLRGNPRALAQEAQLTEWLLRNTADLRAATQHTLACLPSWNTRGRGTDLRGPTATPSDVLSIGLHPEIELHSSMLGWLGRPDLLQVTEEGCAIFDFKTGAPNENHLLQVHAYALLWADDATRNPHCLPVSSLHVVYGSHTDSWPGPDVSDTSHIRRELAERTELVRRATQHVPPEAIPDERRCAMCGVRQLCGDYWAAMPQWSPPDTGAFIDLAVVFEEEGASQSTCVVLNGAPRLRGQRVLVKWNGGPGGPEVGDRTLLLGVRVTQLSDDTPTSVSWASTSEAFLDTVIVG